MTINTLVMAQHKKTHVARRFRAASSEQRATSNEQRAQTRPDLEMHSQPANANPGLATSLRWRVAFPVMRSNVHIHVCTLTGRSVFEEGNGEGEGEGEGGPRLHVLLTAVCYHGKSLVANRREEHSGFSWLRSHRYPLRHGILCSRPKPFPS